MTYEPQTLEPAFFSWETDDTNQDYYLNPPLTTPVTPYNWDVLPDEKHIGKVLASGSPDAEAALNLIADHQCVSPKQSAVLSTDNKPSLELFQEMVWDRTEDLGLTDDEVKDLSVWTGHKFLGYSLGAVGKAWGLTKKQAECIVRRFDRRKDKPQGKTDVANAALVLANAA